MKDTFGEPIKEHEFNSLSIVEIEGFNSFLVRLDGKKFSTFTRGLPKPYDKVFSLVMMLTTNDIVDEYHAQFGYTHSDEITIGFNAKCAKKDYDENTVEKREHSHKGRVAKIISQMAAYCTLRFNFHYMKEIQKGLTNYEEHTNKKILSMKAIFDARILVFPLEKQNWWIAHHMVWRSMYDCYRNGLSTFADHYIGKKKTVGMDARDKYNAMIKVGLDFKLSPQYYRHGSYIKKIIVDKECLNPKTGEKVIAKRSKLINFTMCVDDTDSRYQDLLMSKYLTDELRSIITESLDLTKIVSTPLNMNIV